MLASDPLSDSQTETGALTRARLQTSEPLEYSISHGRSDSGPVVSDVDCGTICVGLDPQSDVSGRSDGRYRVFEKIADDPGNSRRVSVDDQRQCPEANLGSTVGPGLSRHLSSDVLEIHSLNSRRTGGFEACQIQQVGHQSAEARSASGQ